MPSPKSASRVQRALALGLVLAALSGCSPAPPAEPPVARALVHASTQPATFAVVGDSITAWTNDDAPSWVASAVAPRVVFAGGWAVPGATTADMLAGLADMPRADVLVIMAGTNDFLPEFPEWKLSASLDRIREIASRSSIDRVVLSAIAPNDYRPELTTTFNIALHALANRQGWGWVDPWPSARASDGTYVSGASLDGIHPVPAVEQRAGGQLRSAVLLTALAP